jgi:hypothetical protein
MREATIMEGMVMATAAEIRRFVQHRRGYGMRSRSANVAVEKTASKRRGPRMKAVKLVVAIAASGVVLAFLPSSGIAQHVKFTGKITKLTVKLEPPKP